MLIRQERLNERGETICEYCGKPIIREYDCIGHHTIELTEDNVGDASISLNPDLIMLVHHRCHNKIHNKLSYSGRQIWLVYGPPLSGKTSWVNGVREDGDLVIDMDSIWECVSGCERYNKPGRLNQCAFAVRDTLLDCVKYRRGKWLNAYVIGGYPFTGERERLVRELGAREIFIDVGQAECLERLKACDDGRDKAEWEKYIQQWFRIYAPQVSSI